MYACMHVCMYVFMYVCMYEYICVYVCMYVCVSGAKTILRVRFWAPSIRQTVLCVRFGQISGTNFNPRKFSQYSGFQIHATRDM